MFPYKAHTLPFCIVTIATYQFYTPVAFITLGMLSSGIDDATGKYVFASYCVLFMGAGCWTAGSYVRLLVFSILIYRLAHFQVIQLTCFDNRLSRVAFPT